MANKAKMALKEPTFLFLHKRFQTIMKRKTEDVVIKLQIFTVDEVVQLWISSSKTL